MGFSFGYPVDARVQDAVDTLNLGEGWYPAIDTDGGIRDGAWVAEATDLVNLATWPAGTRLILRKERPHPGAQLRFTDADGHAGHRVHHRHRDPVSCPAKSPAWNCGTVSTPASRTASANSKPPACATCRVTSFWANAAWLEIVLAAADLVTWTRLIGFRDPPGLARAEITTFRYRVLHVAARITRGARQLRLRIDATWRWATPIATAWQRIRTAFG